MKHKMVDNPFVMNSKIPDRYFCDRERETEELIRLLLNGNNVVLISERRMGKTGLIYHCYEDPRLKSNYHTLFIDILQTSTFREFTFLLGKEVFRVLASRGMKLITKFIQTVKSLSGKLGFDPASGMPTLDINLGDVDNPHLTLEEIFRYLESADKPCIVAIDEFQQITEYPEKNVEAILRTHIQKLSNCHMIYSGSKRHILGEMFVSAARPFYHSSSFIELGVIPSEIFEGFIIKNFEDFGKEISAEEAGRIYRMFEGHTFYVQRTCNEAFNYTPRGGICTGEIVDYAIKYILNSYAVIYRETLSVLSEKQKQLLYAIAETGEAERITSETFIKRHSLPSASSVQSAARMLLQKDLITRNEEKYRVSDRYFGLWIQRMLKGDA